MPGEETASVFYLSQFVVEVAEEDVGARLRPGTAGPLPKGPVVGMIGIDVPQLTVLPLVPALPMSFRSR